MWQKENPEWRFHFRPYKAKASESKEVQEHVIVNESCTFRQTLLYVNQKSWQQQMLKRYGNAISLMDATYKTAKYELALFFIAVKINVGYSVVAEFVVQSEMSEQISEALS